MKPQPKSMKPILKLLALAFVLSPLAAQAAAPLNDKFVNATVLNGRAPTLRNQTGAGSTPDVLDPYLHGVKPSRSVWYRFDAPFAAKVRLLVAHSTGARLGAFRLADLDGGPGSLEFVSDVEDLAAGTTSTLTFTSVSRQRYYICIETVGTFDLTLQISGPANDFFADAVALAGNKGTIVTTNLNATDAGDSPANPGVEPPTNGIWYTWTPTFTGTGVVSTNFSFLYGSLIHDTRISIYTGTTLANLVPLAHDDDSGYNFNSRVSFPVTSGTTYVIWVGDYSGNAGDGTINLEYFSDTDPGEFSIFMPQFNVGEDQGTAAVEVRRAYAGNTAPSVTLSTANGSAANGSDYTSISSVLNFASSGESAFALGFSIPILADTVAESSETVLVQLSAPTLGALTGSAKLFTILDEPVVSAPGFTSTTLRVKENAGFIQFPITRFTAAGVAGVTIGLNGNNGTASPNDYSFSTIHYTFKPGQASDIVTVLISNDGLAEGDETINLNIIPDVLSMPVDGSKTLSIVIEDDDAPLPTPGRLSAVFDNTIAASLDMTVNANGMVTGKLIMTKAAYPFTGKLDASGFLLVRIGPATSPNRTLSIQLLSSADKTYKLVLNDNDQGFVSTANVTATNFSAFAPCPAMGTYTLADNSGASPLQSIPVPVQYAATLKVDALGTATLAGKTFDGMALAAVGAVDPFNRASVGATLYAGQGRFTVSAVLPDQPQTLGSGIGRYVRPGRAAQMTELPSLNSTSSCLIARYVVPPTVPPTRALTIWSFGTGNADISAGGFGAITQSFGISPTNVISLGMPPVPDPKLKLTITAATGLFSGTVTPPAIVATAKPMYGVLIQAGASSKGLGFFLNGITPGKVVLRGL